MKTRRIEVIKPIIEDKKAILVRLFLVALEITVVQSILRLFSNSQKSV